MNKQLPMEDRDGFNRCLLFLLPWTKFSNRSRPVTQKSIRLLSAALG
jgi:hypothetical protein